MHVARSCHLKGHVICASEQVVLAPVISHALNMIHCLQKLARLPADPCHRTCFQCHLRIDQVCTDLLPEAILHSCFTLVATRAPNSVGFIFSIVFHLFGRAFPSSKLRRDMEEFGRRGDDHFYEGLSHVSETQPITCKCARPCATRILRKIDLGSCKTKTGRRRGETSNRKST